MARYAGESLAKKVARVRLYLRAKRLLDAAGVECKTVFIMPGPEAAEVGCLRHILKPERILAVDRDPEAIEALLKKTGDDPFEITSWTSELSKAVLEERYQFANFDLMSNLNGRPGELLSDFMGYLAPGGVAAVTYLRAREIGTMHERVDSAKLAFRVLDLPREMKRLFAADPRAWVVYNEVVDAYFWKAVEFSDPDKTRQKIGYDWRKPSHHQVLADMMRNDLAKLNIVNFIPVATYNYRAEVSPMGVMMVQGIHGKPTDRWIRERMGKVTNCPLFERRLIASVVKKKPMRDIINEVDHLESMGFEHRAIAEILNVKFGTLSAWRAHETMGTYVKEA